MGYSYTRKQAFITGTTRTNIISMILLAVAVMISYAAGAQAPCGITVSINSVNVSCYGGNDGSATVMVSGGTAPYSYSWSANASASTSVATGLAAGSYTVTVTDTAGCSMTSSVTITQPSAALSVNATGIDPTCSSGTDGSVTANVSGGTAPYSYSWSTSPVQATATVPGLSGGVYTVTVTDLNGCIAIDSIALDSVTPVVAVVTGVDTICQDQNYPQDILLVASGGTSYLWSTGSNTNGSVVIPMTTTTYSVIVSNGACSDTAYFTVTAAITPQPWISGATSSCAGDAVMLTANGGASFVWSTGETSASIIVTPTVTTTYTVTAFNGICSGSVTQTVNVSSISAEIVGCTTPCAGSELKYEVGVTGASTYEWGVPAGWAIVSGQGTASIIVRTGDASSDGSIKISTTGTGCTAFTAELAADVTECRDEMKLVNTFTPNSDGYNDTWEIPNIKSYPGNELKIVNRWGNEVFRATDYDNSWDGAGLPEGTYFYVLKVTSSGSDNNCATGIVKDAEYKGYVTIVR